MAKTKYQMVLFNEQSVAVIRAALCENDTVADLGSKFRDDGESVTANIWR